MEAPVFETRTDLSALHTAVEQVKEQIGKVVIGQQQMVELIITALLADGHLLLEGVPGVAKTLTAKATARCLNVQFNRVQFTPDLMPSDVLGTPVFNTREGSFEFKRGPIFSNIVLIDEINRAPAKTQAALFEVMEERQVTIDGKTYHMPPPFIVIATQNPVEQEGTYRLPEAQLDRFLFKVLVDYPSAEEELQMLTLFNGGTIQNPLQSLQPVLDAAQVAHLRTLVKSIVVDEKLLRFITDVVRKTRNHASVYLGASPRAALALLNSAKAYAAVQGRDFVLPDDVIHLAPPVLRHRLVLSPEKEMEGLTEDALISQILHSIEVPR